MTNNICPLSLFFKVKFVTGQIEKGILFDNLVAEPKKIFMVFEDETICHTNMAFYQSKIKF